MAGKTGSARPARRTARRSHNTTVFLLLFVMLPAMAFFLSTFLLLLIGLLPTFSAWVADRDPEKSAPITVGALNICGVMPFLLQLWRGPNTLAHSLTMMAHPMTWLIMYGAAAMGWALYFLVPPIVASMVFLSHESRVRSLEGQQRTLVEEWGAEVTGEVVEEEEETW